jgi:hypothetical protein
VYGRLTGSVKERTASSAYVQGVNRKEQPRINRRRLRECGDAESVKEGVSVSAGSDDLEVKVSSMPATSVGQMLVASVGKLDFFLVVRYSTTGLDSDRGGIQTNHHLDWEASRRKNSQLKSSKQASSPPNPNRAPPRYSFSSAFLCV